MSTKSQQPIVVLQYDQLPQCRVVNIKSGQSVLRVEGDTDEAFLSTRSISTYPLLPCGEKDGDPIADKLYVQVHRNRAIMAVADGCNWGRRPVMAACDAIAAFAQYFDQRQSEIQTLHDAGHYLLRAFCEAHNKIIQGKSDIWEAGTTTLLGGLVMELEDDSGAPPRWGFLCASVGDCKAFLLSMKRREATDVTSGNRFNITDTRDPGGRLGPYIGQGWPDLRNLKLYFTFCEENDIAVIVSDGVHDNLDPVMLGKLPAELNINAHGWEELSHEELLKTKSMYMKKLLEEIVFGSGRVAPSEITKKLIDHCAKVTHRSRDYMEKFPNKKQPVDYREYPGKMDHTTCVSFQIGRSK
ncbi:hypothetical protein SAMD00019534_047410 [Acytostelium subglobosum LB1]|uniref:hypothetical protein n=1 Tax=Acytostelium subglobosum LB1 TaxID=1410327 RepID=UPI000644B370|nr:hypothetical protein SAMD00019534_047410 [Acytostelium subglobosum LB1]GAM21566.1 hypothetical protein SAMD00019534_047410 [Acytostelium subglobosum LB1]|eukprot:XP_012755685.1 hypothetical protein SAMD00019534_047410 [Acytostelium subglobosum LB1]